MKNEPAVSREGLDWISLSVYLMLVLIGWLMLYSINYTPEDPYSFFNPRTSMGQATVFVIVALIVFFAAYTIEWRIWSIFAYPIFGFSVFLLILVLFFGNIIKGSQSWFNLFGFSFQPSEFAKFGTALAVASFISHYKQSLNQIKIFGLGLLLVFVPMLLIMLQPDAGSAIVFASLLFSFFRNGASPFILVVPFILLFTFLSTLLYGFPATGLGVVSLSILVVAGIYYQNRYMIISVVAVIIGLILLFINSLQVWALISSILVFYGLSFYYWFRNPRSVRVLSFGAVLVILLISGLTSYTFHSVLKPHQQERLHVWLHPEKSDPLGALYNIVQSKMAIGSGGLTGKGYLEGAMTSLEYVPEQSTDFIFTTIGEEQGFIGVVGLLFLYLVLILRIIKIGERSNNKFILSYAYAVGGYFFFHFFINIGMTMGLVPVIGIPLPLLSRGGSSLVFFSLMLGVLLKLDTVRRLR